jgi:hypothetical protein
MTYARKRPVNLKARDELLTEAKALGIKGE